MFFLTQVDTNRTPKRKKTWGRKIPRKEAPQEMANAEHAAEHHVSHIFISRVNEKSCKHTCQVSTF